jgi:hypothetical protein
MIDSLIWDGHAVSEVNADAVRKKKTGVAKTPAGLASY